MHAGKHVAHIEIRPFMRASAMAPGGLVPNCSNLPYQIVKTIVRNERSAV